MEFPLEKRIGLVTTDLFYIILTYWTQQERFRLGKVILLAVFGTVDEPLASFVVVQF